MATRRASAPDQPLANSRTVKPGFVDAFKLSAQRNWQWATMIVQTLGGLFTRDTPVKQLMGPVAIAGLSGEAAAGRLDLSSSA